MAGSRSVSFSLEYLNSKFDFREDEGTKVISIWWKEGTPCKKSKRAEGDALSEGYKAVSLDRVRVRSHRLIYMYLHNIDSTKGLPKYIDHKDGNKTNNTRDNLRDGAYGNINDFNRVVKNENGFKGVSKDKISGKFRSKLKINGNYATLGTFKSPEQAAHAYDEACSIALSDEVRGNFKCKSSGYLSENALFRLHKVMDMKHKFKKPNCGLRGIRWNVGQQSYSAYHSVQPDSKTKYIGSNVDAIECMRTRNNYLLDNNIGLELSYIADDHQIFSYTNKEGNLCTILTL